MNKRTHALRHRKRVEVAYGEPGGMRYTGYSGNISRTGMMIRAVRVFGEGTVLDVELKFPSGSIHVKGRVRWAREGSVTLLSTGRIGMGLLFIDPPAELLARIGHSAEAQP